MLREIRDLGFEYAELSHGIRISLMPGILDAVDAGEIKISTLHNFCPLPVGVDAAVAEPLRIFRRKARATANWPSSTRSRRLNLPRASRRRSSCCTSAAWI